MRDFRAKTSNDRDEEEENSLEVRGEIVHEIFRAKDSGFTVLSIKLRSGKTTKLQGILPEPLQKGDCIIAKGKWTNFKGVDQFKADMIQLDLPPKADAIVKWLNRGAVKGVGPATIDRLKKYFGERLPDVIGEEEELVKAVSRVSAQAIARVYNTNAKDHEIVFQLTQSGLGPKTIAKVFEHFGSSIKNVIKTNPWELLEVERVGFKTTDKIAQKNNVSLWSAARIRAGLVWVLTEVLSQWGHCGLPRQELAEFTSKKLSTSKDFPWGGVISPAQVSEQLHEIIDGVNIIEDALTGLIYSRQFYEAENELAAHLVALLHNSEGAIPREQAEQAVLRAERELDVVLDRDGQQFEAAVQALTNAVMVITGGPGTGKSTTQKVIVKAKEYFDRNIALSAPTGRAAKRLTEASGREARTIHRLLEFSPLIGGFLYNNNHQLKQNDVIVDETSMVDIKLAASLFTALGPDACAGLVGDYDQLPSVGPGQVLRDLIESGIIPVVRLTKVHRTTEGSGIALAAQRIRDGLYPLDGEIGKGFEIITANDDNILEELVKLVRFRLPEMGFDPMRDVQILTAQRTGNLGVPVLNMAIKQAINPALKDANTIGMHTNLKIGDRVINEIHYTVGDRVMQTRNDYLKGVYNGEVGTVIEVGMLPDITGLRVPSVKVDFSGAEVRYKQDDITDIEHAFAATVHKSQGCEFPVTIMLMPRVHSRMLNRKLIYTGITRAKSDCFVLGEPSLIRSSIEKTDHSIRYTGLQARLKLYANAHTRARPIGWGS